jgi:hypothetical protein
MVGKMVICVNVTLGMYSTLRCVHRSLIVGLHKKIKQPSPKLEEQIRHILYFLMSSTQYKSSSFLSSLKRYKIIGDFTFVAKCCILSLKVPKCEILMSWNDFFIMKSIYSR